jgi:multiple sugar transport system ATP-binding protein
VATCGAARVIADALALHDGSSGTYLPVEGNIMASVTFDKATRVYPGSDRPAVDALDLEIADGEFLVLVGPSGCGKSTSLRMLAGLEDVNAGRILIGDRDVTQVQPKDRDIAMVFQNYALYPHMTVADNMGFALKIAGTPKAEIETRVKEAAKILDLTEYLGRKPKALSGGQRQRVAMGRAIVRQPRVFLMDEPLSNLDAKLRVQTRTQIASLQRRLGVTTVYVTHDQTEALTMGDRIAVLNFGVLQQVGTPREMYDRPANVFVAGFIGSPAMNLGEFRVVGDEAVLGAAKVPLSAAARKALQESGEDKVIIGFRPEATERVSENTPGALTVTVNLVEELGSDAFIYGSLEGEEEAAKVGSGDDEDQVIIRIDPRDVPDKGAKVHVTIRPDAQHEFSASSGERLVG